MKWTSAYCLICTFLCATLTTEASYASRQGGPVASAEQHTQWSATDLWQDAFSVADSLFRSGDYFFAAIAYERLYFSLPDRQARIVANLCKVQALKQLGRFEEAARDIQRSWPFAHEKELQYLVMYEFTFCSFMADDFQQASYGLQQMAISFDKWEAGSDLALLKCLTFIQLESWDALSDYIEILSSELSLADEDPLLAGIREALAEENRFVPKSLSKARWLATCIPGAGHLYAGEPGKALLNAGSQLLSLGAAGLMAVHGMYIGTFTIGLSAFQAFYFGGIKQAIAHTEARNHRMLQTYKNQLSAMVAAWLQHADKSGGFGQTGQLPGRDVNTYLLASIASYTGGAGPDDSACAETGSVEEGLSNLQEAIFSFNFLQADSICRCLEATYGNHYLSHFARAHFTWWSLITMPESAELENAFREHMGRSLQLAAADTLSLTSNSDIFYLVSMHATQARLDLKKGSYIRAARNGRSAISFIEQSRGREAEYDGFLLTSGLYNYMTVEASRKYPFLRVYTLFYPSGDKTLGIRQLKMAAASDDNILKTEAHYFLMRILLDMENDPEAALHHAAWLTSAHPLNLIYHYYHLLILQDLHNEEAVREKKEVIVHAANTNRGISRVQKEYFLRLIRTL